MLCGNISPVEPSVFCGRMGNIWWSNRTETCGDGQSSVVNSATERDKKKTNSNNAHENGPPLEELKHTSIFRHKRYFRWEKSKVKEREAREAVVKDNDIDKRNRRA